MKKIVVLALAALMIATFAGCAKEVETPVESAADIVISAADAAVSEADALLSDADAVISAADAVVSAADAQ